MLGSPGIQHSGKATSLAPAAAAEAMMEQVLVTPAARSSQAGSCWVTATRMVGGGGDRTHGVDVSVMV